MKQLVHNILEMLSRADARPNPVRAMNSQTIGLLVDRLHFGAFQIREQLSSGPNGERINILGRKGPATGAPLWLVAQTGLGAQPIPGRWSALDGEAKQPSRSSRDNTIVGFGSQSGRVDILLKILAAATIAPEKLKRPIHIAALSGEEGVGSGALMLLGMPELRGGTAIVHGPTTNTLWNRHPGCVALQLVLNRRVRHRRMPPHAGFWQFSFETAGSHCLATKAAPEINALAIGRQILDRLREHGEIRVLSFEAGETGNRVPGRCFIRVATGFEEPPSLRDIHPDIQVAPIPEGTALPLPVDRLLAAWFRAQEAGLAAIEGRTGLARNTSVARPPRQAWTGRVTSDRDVVSGPIMIWTGPGVDAEEISERFAAAADEALRGEDEIEMEIDVLLDRPAFDASEGAEALFTSAGEELGRLGLSPTPGAGLVTTDAGLFRQQGLETLVFGSAGPIENLYRDNEAIGIDRLEAAYRFYERMIHRLCVER